MLNTATTDITLHALDASGRGARGYVVELYDRHDSTMEIRHCCDIEVLRRVLAPHVRDTDLAITRLLRGGSL